MRIAINGLGRIGKNFLWVLLTDKNALKKIMIEAINIGPAKREMIPYLFKYDSLLGTYPGTVSLADDNLIIDDLSIPLVAETDALRLPWKKMAIEWVVDCSGKYTHRQKAQEHLTAGARAVLISAPGYDEDVMIIPGVNDSCFDKNKHTIVSLGSCTTNALLPLLKVLHEEFVVQNACMTTIHAYTNSQVLLDVNDHNARRSRAAAINIIPTTTGASESVAKVIPELGNKVTGIALRVPIDKVSLIDLAFQIQKETDRDGINSTFKKAADGLLNGIMSYSDQQLVSSDFKGNSSSVIFDATLTEMQGSLGKVFGWYDNEWAYSQRLKDFLISIS
jgi:glyceraldehyde-3-phosphate dehydrogenase type I